jgi:hypothetical protein
MPTIGDKTICLDYIGLVNGVVCVPGSHTRHPGLARGMINKDHIPIGANVIVSLRNANSVHKRRIVDYDPNKFDDPEKAAAFVAILRDFPSVGVEVENTSHCFLLEIYVHDALVECFPKDKCSKTKAYITDMTFDIIVKGHKIRKSLFGWGRKMIKSVLFALFGAWSNRPWRCKWSLIWGFNKLGHLKGYTKAEVDLHNSNAS